MARSIAGALTTIETLKTGTGASPKSGDTVSMHYTGTLASNGTKFDSSVDRGQPFTTQIGVGRVIKGWDVGVPQMKLGEKAILRIPAAEGCKSLPCPSPPVLFTRVPASTTTCGAAATPPPFLKAPSCAAVPLIAHIPIRSSV